MNRRDLTAQPVQAAPGQQYGQRAAQERSQQAVPMAGAPAAASSTPAPIAPSGPPPGGLGELLRPTERPGEPVTAGVAGGAGPGPEAMPPGSDTTIDELRAIYQMTGSESIREIIEDLEHETGFGF